MITGDTLWPAVPSGDLVSARIGGAQRRVFKNAPPDFYRMLLDSSAAYPGKVFIINENGRRYTFSELLKRTDDFAAYLRSNAGVGQGSRVALMLYNGVEFCVAFLALVKLGAVCIPLPTKFRQPEICALVEHCQPNAVICEDIFAGWFAGFAHNGPGSLVLSRNSIEGYGFSYAAAAPLAAPYQGRPGAPAVILFTSGTASQSKGVVIRNYNAVHAVLCYQRAFSLTEKDSSIIPVPMYYVTGLIALFGVFLCCGGTLYLHRFFDAPRVLEDARKGGVTFLHASPTVFSLLLQQQSRCPRLPRLRAIACGGGYLPKPQAASLHQWLPGTAIHTVYGLTETSSPATIFPGDISEGPRMGSSGVPIPGLSVRIVDEAGRELPDHSVGEICLKGTVVMEAYFQPGSGGLQDGWLNTGDLGYLDGDYLYVVDRKTDMINRGGEKIWSPDVENELLRIPGVLNCAVVGICDAVYGEVPAALVQPGPGAQLTEAGMQALLQGRMAHFKVPARIVFAQEIPMTSNAKIDKKAIRAMLQTHKGKE